jgi:hypothetical protein
MTDRTSTAVAQPPRSEKARKDASQLRQKRMIAEHYSRLARAPESGEKSAYTFVPAT